MHKTHHSQVIGNIDNFKEKEENIYLNGWGFHEKYPNADIRLKYERNDSKSEIYIFNNQFSSSRLDVADYYKNPEMGDCGWKFSLKKDNNKIKNLEVQMNFENNWNTFFSFLLEDGRSSLSSNKDNDLVSFSEIDPPIQKDLVIPSKKYIPSLVVVDHFYNDVDNIRKLALEQIFYDHPDNHKGKRTEKVFRFEGLKESFENILGIKIKNWDYYPVNGCFQTCIAGDPLVYHFDIQEYAGILFLSPDAPPETGTSFYRSKINQKSKIEEKEIDTIFKTGFFDSTQFDVVDVIGNVYNRLILFDAKQIHAASTYFGNTLENGRLFQLFFFDLEK